MRSRSGRSRDWHPPAEVSLSSPDLLEARRLLAGAVSAYIGLQDPDTPGSPASEATIGERLTFTLNVTITTGTFDNFRIDTRLPEGFALVSLDSLGASSVVSTTRPGGFDAILRAAQGQLAASQSPTLDFGTLLVPSGFAGSLILKGTVVVTNSPAAHDGALLPAQMAIRSGSIVLDTPTSPPILIQEPSLAVEVSAHPLAGEPAAGPVEYTVTVSHAPTSHAPAYDIDVAALLGSGLEVVPGSLTIISGPAASPTGPLGIAIPKLLPGESVTFRYRALVNGSATPGGTVETSARATWTSRPGDINRPQSPLDPASTERTGTASDPGGSLNDYRAGDSFDLPIRGRRLDGSVYVDLNFNGTRDADEPGIAGVSITLTGRDVFGRSVAKTAITDAAGHYSFDNLYPSDAAGYTLSELQPGGLIDGPERIGTAAGIPIGTLAGDDEIAAILLSPGGIDPTGYDFGEWPPSELSGRTFLDRNGDGRYQPATEPGLSGITFRLTGKDDRGRDVDLTIRTGPDGTFAFPMLRPAGPDGYTLTQVQPDEYLDGETSAPRGSVAYNAVTRIVLGRGESLGGFSFAELEPASLSGQVFIDPENDGIRSPGEAGLAGIAILLTGTDDRGNPVSLTTTTAADGTYHFTRLRPSGPGGYIVAERQADVDAAGLLDGKDATVPGTDASIKNQFGSIILSPGTDLSGLDFAELRPSSLAGLVFHDAFEDGTYGPGDSPVAGVTVILSGRDDRGAPVNLTVQTDANGIYTFRGLRPSGPDGYRLFEIQPAHLLDGDARPGTAGGLALSGDEIGTIRLGAGTDATGYVFRELTPRADLAVTITAPPDRPDVGDEIAVVIGVENLGPSIPDLYELELNLPPGLSLLNAVPSIGTFDSATGRWSVPAQGVGTHAELRLRLRVARPEAGEIRAAIRTSSIPDPNDSNDRATATIKPLVSDLSIAVATSANRPAIGDVVQLTVELANAGPDSARGVGVQVSLPAGVRPAGLASGSGTYDPATGLWRLDQINPGSLARLTIPVQIIAPAPGTFRAEVAFAKTYDSDSTPGNGAPGEDDLASLVQEALPLSSLSGSVLLADAGNPTGPALGGIPGVRIFLTGTDVLGQPVARETVTDSRGTFAFDSLFPGTYTLREEQPAAYNDGPDFAGSLGGIAGNDVIGSIVVGGDRHGAGYEFRELGSGVSGSVFVDANRNGIRDGNEIGLDGIRIALVDAGGATVATATTRAGGFYNFDNVPLGTYTIRQLQQPLGYGSSTPNEIRGVVVTANGRSGLDFGETTGSLSGSVFADINRNGIRDAGDEGLAGIEIVLTGTDVTGATIHRSAITNATGAYLFDGLLEGTYSLTQPRQPAQYLDGPEFAGTAGGTIPTPDRDAIEQIRLGAGQQATGYLFSELSGIDLSVVSFTADQRSPRIGDLITFTLVIRNDGPMDATGVRVSVPLPGGLEYRFDRPSTGLYDPVTGTWSIGNIAAGEERTLVLQAVAIGGSVGQVVAEVSAADQVDLDSTPGNGAPGEDDIAFIDILPRSTLTGRVYLDRDEDGAFSGSDVGIANVLIQLTGTSADGKPVALETFTDEDGSYRFTDLIPGQYAVIQYQPKDYRNGPSTPGSVGGIAGDNVIERINIGGGQFAFGYDFAELPTNLVGSVFLDANRNGTRDPGEAPAPRATVQLLDALGRVLATATTDNQGIYRFDGLAPGGYTILCLVPTGYGLSTPNRVQANLTVESGAGADFGLTLGAISGDVFIDHSDDGIRNPDEAGLAGILVHLVGVDDRGAVVEKTIRTRDDGSFSFDQLLSGTYQVRADLPDGLFAGLTTAGGSGGVIRNDQVEDIRMAAGSAADGLGFAALRPARLAGQVAFDRDEDEKPGATDPPIAGVEIRLTGIDHRGQPVALVTQTDARGRFEFANLRPSGPGGYRIEEVQPAAFRDGPALPAPDRVVRVVTNAFEEIALQEGDNGDGFYFLERGVVLAGYVFNDVNRNGRMDPNEQGIPNQALTLQLADGRLVEVVATDAQGRFRFSPVISNAYSLTLGTPAGLVATTMTTRDLILTPGYSGTTDFGFAQPEGSKANDQPDPNENLPVASNPNVGRLNLAVLSLGQIVSGPSGGPTTPALTTRYSVQSSSTSTVGGGSSAGGPTTAMDNATKNGSRSSAAGSSEFDLRALLNLTNLDRIRDRADGDWVNSIRGLSDWESLARALIAAGIGRDVAELQPVLNDSLELVATFPDIFRPAAPTGLRLDALRDDAIPDSAFLPLPRLAPPPASAAIPAIPARDQAAAPRLRRDNPILRRMSGLDGALEDAKRGVRERFRAPGAGGGPTSMDAGNPGAPEASLPVAGGAALAALGWWLSQESRPGGCAWRRRQPPAPRPQCARPGAVTPAGA